MTNGVLRILLVDDDPACREELRQHLAAFPYAAVVGEAGDLSTAIACLRNEAADLIFLDIELGGESGFDLARHIRNTNPSCKIIFLTGHVDFALEGYEYGPADFLVKPTNLLRLEQALLRVREHLEAFRHTEDTRIGIQSGNRLEIVSVRQVLYLEKRGRQVVLVCEGGEELMTKEPLQKLEGAFLPHGFYRCHQSFLVPLRRIRSIQLDDSKHTYFLLLDGTDARIPLSRDKCGELRRLLSLTGLETY